jgi:hypothetical protein
MGVEVRAVHHWRPCRREAHYAHDVGTLQIPELLPRVLEVSYQLVRVEAWAVNRGKRLIKSPKH